MKIGILTFHCAHNYGAVLQAYGLQEYLKSCGHEVEIIDYRPRYLTKGNGVFLFPGLTSPLMLFRWVLRCPLRVLEAPLRIYRRAIFEKFISEKLNLSSESFGEDGCVPVKKYDAIVFGSDQIWSPSHTRGGDPIFLGNFTNSAGTLKIAYAASAGAASETLGENKFVVNALKNFDAISVREANLAAALQSKTELKIETVLDPTLLVDKSVWEKLAVPPKAQKKYVLVYQVSYNPEADRIAKEFAEQIGADVVSIWAGFWRSKGKVVSPSQFLGLFRNADCVVTTSFHGTAFGLIFEKPLYYVGNGNAAENRPKQILEALGLSGRYILGTENAPKFSKIPYKENMLGDAFECIRERSRKVLENSLRGVVGTKG